MHVCRLVFQLHFHSASGSGGGGDFLSTQFSADVWVVSGRSTMRLTLSEQALYRVVS